MSPEGNVRKSRTGSRAALAIALAAGAAVPELARADGRLWIGSGTSNWSISTNWFAFSGGSGVPLSGDDVYLTQSDANDRTVTYDGNYISPSNLASLTIDATGTGTMVFSQAINRFRADLQYVGDFGAGIYRQSGSANDANTLYLGYSASGLGSYSLSNTAALNIGTGLYVGYSGNGILTQTGGTLTVTNGAELVLAYLPNSNGTYSMSGGTLNTPGLRIADDASTTGQFVQSGGTVTIANDLEIATATSGAGSYSISAGKLTVGRNLYLGEAGTGTFMQSGGTVAINGGGTNGLIIGASPVTGSSAASIGSYLLGGTGQLNVTGRIYVGFAGNGTFTQTGGSTTINGRLVLASTTGTNTSAADLSLQGGSLAVVGEGVIQLNPGGTFSQTGGTLSFTTFNMDGGVVNGALANPGTFNYSAGTFNGRLVNAVAAAVNLSADFAAGNGMDNAATLSFGSNRTIAFNGTGLNNTGRIQLLGSLLTGSGPLVNIGTLAGAGTISGSGGFTNRGTFNVDAGDYRITNTGPIVNASTGVITLAPSTAGRSLVLDGPAVALDNVGRISLGQNSAIAGTGLLTNDGLIVAGPGTTIDAPYVNKATLTVGLGVTNLGDLGITQPFANTGTIQLLDPANVLSGGQITNTGQITGPGRVDNPIANAGVIAQFGAAPLTLSGVLQNQAAGSIQVGAGGSILAPALAANAGTITIAPAGTLSAGVFPNSGQINVGGTLDVDGITNTGTITYTGGAASIDSFGPITNAPGGAIALGSSNPTVLFYDDLVHQPGASVTLAAGATANFLGNVSGGGDVSNTGTINLSANKTYTLGEISGPSGAIALADSARLTTSRITQASLTIGIAGGAPATVTLNAAATPGVFTSRLTTLTIAGGSTPVGRLDLANTNLLIDYAATSPIDTVRAQLRAGYNAGGARWTGMGIVSSAAAADSTTALGYAEAADVLHLSGGATGDWFGQTADATSLLVRYTKAGDATLDGVVDFNDLVKLAQHYNDTSGTRYWYDGDFDYDGNVDFNDLVKLAQNYNQSLASPPVASLGVEFSSDFARALAAVPEPGATALLVLATGASLVRRRRKCHPAGV